MSISYEVLLAKMELELMKAKQAAKREQKLGHIYALKALAEVILDDGEQPVTTERESLVISQPRTAEITQPVNFGGQKPLKTEDGSNGNSIFEF